MYRRSVHGKKGDEEKPQLFLEKTPSPDSEREFDEIVPDFMHRDFYRSQEELEVVPPEGAMKLKRTKIPFAVPAPPATPATPVTPVDPPAPEPLRTPPTPPPPPPLEPLRSSEDTVTPVPSKSSDEPPSQGDASGGTPSDATAAPKKSGSPAWFNFPLLLCFLIVVGIFWWREQTRPPVSESDTLPVPRVVQVQEESTVVSDEPADSIYPGMDPTVSEIGPVGPEPLESELDRQENGSDEAVASEEDSSDDESMSASERAAVLDRVNGEVPLPPAPQEEVPLPPAEPEWTEQPSLFPAEARSAPPAEARPAPPPVPSQPVVSEAPVSAPVTRPVETAPLPPVEVAVPARPVAEPVPAGPSGVYQIDEPNF